MKKARSGIAPIELAREKPTCIGMYDVDTAKRRYQQFKNGA